MHQPRLSHRTAVLEGHPVRVGDQDLAVASLADIIRSKQAAARPKDDARLQD
ncbi:MAG: hypothetical protein ACRDZ8_00105 [Acidimicrobiales bacterium]